MIQKYAEQFKKLEQFASINGQIISVPVEPENPLRTVEMPLEDNYGTMKVDAIVNTVNESLLGSGGVDSANLIQ